MAGIDVTAFKVLLSHITAQRMPSQQLHQILGPSLPWADSTMAVAHLRRPQSTALANCHQIMSCWHTRTHLTVFLSLSFESENEETHTEGSTPGTMGSFGKKTAPAGKLVLWLQHSHGRQETNKFTACNWTTGHMGVKRLCWRECFTLLSTISILTGIHIKLPKACCGGLINCRDFPKLRALPSFVGNLGWQCCSQQQGWN